MSFYYEKALWQCHLRGRNNLVDRADRLTGKQASRGKWCGHQGVCLIVFHTAQTTAAAEALPDGPDKWNIHIL